jgi:hypothetical protein
MTVKWAPEVDSEKDFAEDGGVDADAQAAADEEQVTWSHMVPDLRVRAGCMCASRCQFCGAACQNSTPRAHNAARRPAHQDRAELSGGVGTARRSRTAGPGTRCGSTPGRWWTRACSSRRACTPTTWAPRLTRRCGCGRTVYTPWLHLTDPERERHTEIGAAGVA